MKQHPTSCEEETTCTSTSSQFASVKIPIHLQPYAIVKEITTQCCDEPILSIQTRNEPSCTCGYELLITQNICIHIPIEFGAACDIGDIQSECTPSPCCEHTYRRK
ncbi:MAG: hypothetical protein RSC10_09510 [Longicatena sp.]